MQIAQFFSQIDFLLSKIVLEVTDFHLLIRNSFVGDGGSQFGDIYEEDYFIDYLKEDVRIVKQLPFELQSLDLEAIDAW